MVSPSIRVVQRNEHDAIKTIYKYILYIYKHQKENWKITIHNFSDKEHSNLYHSVNSLDVE